MANLLEETIRVLNNYGKKPDDVLWVGRDYIDWDSKRSSYKCTWESFSKKANFYYYDNGYGGIEVPLDLIIVGADFWLERHEYDGREWWEFKAMPIEPDEIHELDLSSFGIGDSYNYGR